jgi:uncharacterized protein involved in response to NO
MVPAWLFVWVDVSFLPIIAVIVFRTVWKVRQTRNLTSPILLILMTGANLLWHAGVRAPNGIALGTEAMLYLVLLLISVFGGRVIPFFVGRRLPATAPLVFPPLEWACPVALVGFAMADLVSAPASLVAILGVITAILHAVRWTGWHAPGVWCEPMLGVLFVGYAWLIIGLLLKVASLVGGLNPLVVRHAFAVGCIGTMTLGMMCRVTLGHTGRIIRASRCTFAAFVCITASALLRVGLPILFPSAYVPSLHASATLWTVSFALFVVGYGPMLIRPRVDGRPG